MTPVHSVAIFVPLIVALPTVLATIMIHGLAVLAVVYFVRRERRLGRVGIGFWRDLFIVSGTALLALLAHLIEVVIWALVFESCGEFSQFSAALYHSAANYTSLGYGDIVMSAAWRLLGPLETANGLVLFGVTTAIIFAVTERLIQTRYKFEDDQP
ncbi:MAG: two pore domain potassium channel family protein [Deltaproteobacteria bacterium]|nr:two pore domain potassium channel family protein [Deltaproteobacteria bacterium]